MRSTVLAISAAAAVAVGLICSWEHWRPPVRSRVPQDPTVLIETPDEVRLLQYRSQAKARLAQRVIAERIPLPEAAELFREANGEAGMANLRCGMYGRSVREKLCRQVIMFVAAAEYEMELAGQSGARPPVSGVLREELDRRLAAGEFPPEPGVE